MNQNPKDPKGQIDPKDQNRQDFPGSPENQHPSGKSPEPTDTDKQAPDASRTNWEYPTESAHLKNQGINNKSVEGTKKDESPSRPSPEDDEDDYDEDTREDELIDDDEEF